MKLLHFSRFVLAVFVLAWVSPGSADADFALNNLVSFNGANGMRPSGNLLADSNGNIYGTTYLGGTYGYGTVFELSPSYLGSGHTVKTLASFVGGDGADLSNPAGNGGLPNAGLVADAAGDLYGTTQEGGTAGGGTVYELDAANHKLTTLASFSFGSDPLAPLTIDTSGNLYGTTADGGAYGAGSIFKIDSATHTLTTLFSFDPANAVGAVYGVVVDRSGNVYGTIGSSRNPVGIGGAVFELPASGGTPENLAIFNGSNGWGPTRLMLDASGNIYGTTGAGGTYGGGTIFKIDATTHTLTTLANFDGNGPPVSPGVKTDGAPPSPDGNAPNGSLIEDANGNLYGTTFYGGTNILGTVFKFDVTTQTLTTLVSFDGANGAYPYGGLIADPNGNLYGSTQFGGDLDDGTIFEVSAPEPGPFALFACVSAALLRRRRR